MIAGLCVVFAKQFFLLMIIIIVLLIVISIFIRGVHQGSNIRYSFAWSIFEYQWNEPNVRN